MPGGLIDYSRYIAPGKRVRVGLPLPDGKIFQEWGMASSLHGDLLDLDLSRDFLPEHLKIDLGLAVSVAVLDRKEKLACRGVVVGAGDGRLAVRLVDPMAPCEPREFFRQDVYLPLDYRIPARQVTAEIRERWRQSRWSLEFAGQQPGPGETEELAALREEIRARVEERKELPPIAANISGGGVRLNIAERLRPGILVELSFFLPQPQRVIEVVGEVVQVREIANHCFNTALHFRYIDEVDRDRLISHICGEQLKQLSQQLPGQTREGGAEERRGKCHPLRLAIGLTILALLLGYEARSIVASRERGEKHEIAAVFEKGIFDLLKQRK